MARHSFTRALPLAALVLLSACAATERPPEAPALAAEPSAGGLPPTRELQTAVVLDEMLLGGRLATWMALPQRAATAPGADLPEGITEEEQRTAEYAKVSAVRREAVMRDMRLEAMFEAWRDARATPTPPSREDVRRAQTLLAALGLYEGEIDGLAGPGTRAAVERFQDSAGLPVTGRITPALLARLRLAV